MDAQSVVAGMTRKEALKFLGACMRELGENVFISRDADIYEIYEKLMAQFTSTELDELTDLLS